MKRTQLSFYGIFLEKPEGQNECNVTKYQCCIFTGVGHHQ